MIELKYGRAGRSVILELYDTESDSSYTVGLDELIAKYYSRKTKFGVDGVFNYYKLKRDIPIYSFSVINDNELSCFTCDNFLKSELFDKFDFKITELSQESPA